MRVKIHRGAHEIGGNCVEVETASGERIVLDVGRPLTAGKGEHVPLPGIAGLSEQDDQTLGALITHHHADHWGLVDQVHAGLPIFLGEATQRILRTASFWSMGIDVPAAGHLCHREPIELGPFTITPFLNDHSAFDAFSLLVEADGRRLFYTGDIRGHGRKAGIFQELLRKPPADVDVLLMEGTNIQPGLPAKPTTTESDVEQQMIERFRSTDGIALVVTSAQNIDRLVTIYRATLQSDRDLIMDAYSADIALATGNTNIPRPDPAWPRIRSYLPAWQAMKIKDAGEFERAHALKPHRIFPEEIAEDPSRWVMLFNVRDASRLAKVGALDGATCTWSLWSGYLDEPSGRWLQDVLAKHDIPLHQHHTSGHASVEDLGRLVDALAPGRVVPIHTFGGDSYPDTFGTVAVRADGEWWEV